MSDGRAAYDSMYDTYWGSATGPCWKYIQFLTPYGSVVYVRVDLVKRNKVRACVLSEEEFAWSIQRDSGKLMTVVSKVEEATEDQVAAFEGNTPIIRRMTREVNGPYGGSIKEREISADVLESLSEEVLEVLQSLQGLDSKVGETTGEPQKTSEPCIVKIPVTKVGTTTKIPVTKVGETTETTEPLTLKKLNTKGLETKINKKSRQQAKAFFVHTGIEERQKDEPERQKDEPEPEKKVRTPVIEKKRDVLIMGHNRSCISVLKDAYDKEKPAQDSQALEDWLTGQLVNMYRTKPNPPALKTVKNLAMSWNRNMGRNQVNARNVAQRTLKQLQ